MSDLLNLGRAMYHVYSLQTIDICMLVGEQKTEYGKVLAAFMNLVVADKL